MEDWPGRRLLRGARELVATSWCRGADARDARGRAVDPFDEVAASWSLLGALVAVVEREAAEAGEIPLEELAAALYALAELIETDSLVAWNDEPARTQAAVLGVLDHAEGACESPWAQFTMSSN
jgi:hypothetical protein